MALSHSFFQKQQFFGDADSKKNAKQAAVCVNIPE
jgi:hypothetical protein